MNRGPVWRATESRKRLAKILFPWAPRSRNLEILNRPITVTALKRNFIGQGYQDCPILLIATP